MEILVEILWLFGRLLLELFGEALLELVLAALQKALGRENRNPLVATLGYLVLGGIMGGLSLWMWPQRFLQPGPVPGLSLLISPIAGALAMEAWGRFRQRHDHATTNLATFYGGGAFALGMALVRFIWAR